MRALLIALLALTYAGCSRHEPVPEVAAEVAAFRTEYERMRLEFAAAQAKMPPGEQDFRGRTLRDDMEQWVFSGNTQGRIDEWVERAETKESAAAAKDVLRPARELIQEDLRRAAAISGYWTNHLPVPYWRRYWRAIFEANGLPEEEPDSMLVAIEQRVDASLRKGDFVQAGSDADELGAVLTESLNLATSRILKERSKTPEFAPRSSACVPGAAADPSRRGAKIIRSDEVESFYPGDALTRGETGAVILRTRVNRSGCGTHVAIVVHSGVVALDQAALSWFETAQFAPAVSGGQVIESELTFKVKFELRNR